MNAILFAVFILTQVQSDTVVKTVPTKSPGRAVLMSLIIPGGGQLYTRNYWKAAIIAPAEIGLGYLAYQEHIRMKKALAVQDTSSYYQHRERRTTFFWWTAAVVVFSMADAYVSAQMFGFDEQLRIDLAPNRLGIQLALR